MGVMSKNLLRRFVYALLGGVPASYFVWLASTELFSQTRPSVEFVMLVGVAAFTTIGGWLAICGVRFRRRTWQLVHIAVVGFGVLIAGALAAVMSFGLLMIPAVVGFFVMVDLWQDAQQGAPCDGFAAREL